jgi:hypothetical protein
MSLVTIYSCSEFDACEQINTHLQKHLSEGWSMGKATVLVDGWKNCYELTKNSSNMTVEFDLRPSLPHFSDPMEFTIHSMMLTQPNAIEIMRNIRDGKPPYKTKIWRGVVFWILIGIIAWFIWGGK